jgi:branched-chain amino acid transport system substrate-binding protein
MFFELLFYHSTKVAQKYTISVVSDCNMVQEKKLMYQKKNNLQKWVILTGLLSLSLGLVSACGADTPTTAPATTVAKVTTAASATTVVATSTSATPAVKTVVPVPNGSRIGVTDTEIKVGAIGPTTGPASYISNVLYTIGGYFKMINDQGGIYGRKITYTIADGGFNSEQPLAEAKKLVELDKVFAVSGTLALPDVQLAVRDYFDQNGVPCLPFINNSPQMYDPPHKLQFGIYPPLGPEAKFVVDFAADQLGVKKIAILYASDAPSLGTYLNPFVAEGQAKQLTVTQIAYKLTDTDISSQLKALQQSGAEFVYMPDSGLQIGAVLQEIDKWSAKPKVMLTYYNNDMSIYQMYGKFAEGVYSSWYALPYDGDDPKSIEFRAFMQKYVPDQPPGNFTQGGYIMGQVFVETLRRAGKDLTRESFVAAAESLVNWRDSYANNITYGPLNRLAINSFYVTQYKDGKIQKVSEWYTLK